MARLSFRSVYIAPILAGSKTQTLRQRVPSTVRPGAEIDAICRYDRPPFARLRVVSVRDVVLTELTDADARRDGFPDATSLREVLGATYPGISRLVSVGFRLISR